MTRTIFYSLRGSHAHGLATAASDRDLFKIVLPPEDAILGLQEMRGSQHIKDGEDSRVITLKELLKDALMGRSTEIEMLWAKPEDIGSIDHYGAELVEERHRLISRRLFRSLNGFADGQMKRMLRGNTNRFNPTLGYDPKSAVHGLRALYQVRYLKQNGELVLKIEDEQVRGELMSVKNGEKTLAELMKLFEDYNTAQAAMPEDKLPAKPNYEWANQFLKRTYREHCQ
jgi:predicted nucleotidyltransferase